MSNLQDKQSGNQLDDQLGTYISMHGYKISPSLYQFIEKEVLPGLGIINEEFWQSMANILDEFIPKNQSLLKVRQFFQQQIDAWHLDKNNQPFCQAFYQQFLHDIGYVVPEKEDFLITTENVDPEVATIAGPQLVVPLMNARFALNAANARWGSLYDALYGTDVISDEEEGERTKGYNEIRGAKVQSYAKKFLDQSLPLTHGSHANATAYQLINKQLMVTLASGEKVGLIVPEQLVGFNGSHEKPSVILCCHHGLHLEIHIDQLHPIGKTDPAFVKDIVLESALSTIQDCEDSIAAVDAADKTAVYRNWLGLMKGSLTEKLMKNGQEITRQLNTDRNYKNLEGKNISLPGRSLQFIRNVGHLMTTDAMLTSEDKEVPEGLVDGVITSLIALHDFTGESELKNSRKGSIYIVKPKMHGPDEVKFSNELFCRIEQCLGLAENTIKMGIMDEERRTSANLKECIRAAKERVAFINTGFLDRTGDEIHTSMLAGVMVRKDLMKDEKWIAAYEKRNVAIGLKAGLQGKAQIGKGMWAMPDQMSAMMKTKITHPQSGANCAWVPSPTAATLHVMHYHQVDVNAVQNNLIASSLTDKNTNEQDDLADLLTLPILSNASRLSADDIQHELDNNIQGLLGYVVRWVDQGTGCSKVPDINNVGRMEDRATLRISSQHVCNWLHHGVLSDEQVMASLKRMAVVVDRQNANDENYQAMANNFSSNIAFNAAVDLIFKGKSQPSGYTEPLLHQRRKQVKKQGELTQ